MQIDIGTLTTQYGLLNGTRFQFVTNLGTSVSQGVEAFVEFDPITAFPVRQFINRYIFHLFLASLAYINCQRYQDFERTARLVMGKS